MTSRRIAVPDPDKAGVVVSLFFTRSVATTAWSQQATRSAVFAGVDVCVGPVSTPAVSENERGESPNASVAATTQSQQPQPLH
jgi:hypothetical protein